MAGRKPGYWSRSTVLRTQRRYGVGTFSSGVPRCLPNGRDLIGGTSPRGDETPHRCRRARRTVVLGGEDRAGGRDSKYTYRGTMTYRNSTVTDFVTHFGSSGLS